MSKESEETLARIAYIKEHTAALEEVWTMFISDIVPNKRQWAIWLNKHEFQEIKNAIEITGNWINKEAPDGSMPEDRKIKYLSGVLNGKKFNKMTEAERDAHLSDIRSRAGVFGARKRWQNEKKKVCHDLPSLCQVCHQLPEFCCCSSGSGSRSGSASDSRSGCETTSTVPNPVREKQEQEPTKNLEPTPKPKASAPASNGKACKQCGEPLFRNVSHICSVITSSSPHSESPPPNGDAKKWRMQTFADFDTDGNPINEADKI